MKRLLPLLLLLILSSTVFAADDKISLSGRVKDAIVKSDLTAAYVLTYDATGAVVDSVRANMGRRWIAGGQIDTLSQFYLTVPRVDSTLVFDVVCPGYQTQTVTYTLNKIGKREVMRDIPMIFLERAPRELKELTVTASKIKFYNKGDTVVYNADAFQLAEGSMLDALISQLPGVELNSDGQIKVNGEFVESLLLNGKEFFDGNNNLMLENIAAYTVKDVQVYEGQKSEDKARGDKSAPKVLIMDVRLKKEYNIGWLLNAQGGYGTAGRYIGKLFASWFNPTTRITLVGNLNNLNDNREPGKNDTWTPEQMPSGTKEFRQTGVNYNWQSVDETQTARGQAVFSQTINNNIRTTDRINFLPGGDTYENSYATNRDRETVVQTVHTYWHDTKKALSYGVYAKGAYSDTKNSSSDLSGSFTDEPTTMNAEILDALYSSGKPELLESIINRSRTRADGHNRRLQGMGNTWLTIRLPNSNDAIQIEATGAYSSEKEQLWRDYDINYGANPTPAVLRRQYFDNQPNHTLSLLGAVGYQTYIKSNYLSVKYRIDYSDQVKDSYMYALEQLEDMGTYGVVPGDYLEAFDPANSFTSHTKTMKHSLVPYFSYGESVKDAWITLAINPHISLVHRHLDYWRDKRSYSLTTNNATVSINSIWSGMVEARFGKYGEGQRPQYRNSLRYSYRVEPRLAELTDMLDIVNDANPLNIYYGNPNLKTEHKHRHLFRWSWEPQSHSLNNVLYFGFNHTSNALTRGYTYDTATGVRHNRMYNVGGNHNAAITNELSWQFGRKKQFTLSSTSDADWSAYTDMIGVDLIEPELTKVHNRMLSEKVRLSWNIAGQTLSVRCDYTNRHTTSSQAGFNTLNANHANYGISGVFKLPKGFGISTDFICYTRRGYGVDYLDTTDPVWNARLSWCPPSNSRWLIMADGFDLLHRLSNVNYAVTASGRTVSYTNALPRYFLLSVQYRLNIQPKKR